MVRLGGRESGAVLVMSGEVAYTSEGEAVAIAVFDAAISGGGVRA